MTARKARPRPERYRIRVALASGRDYVSSFSYDELVMAETAAGFAMQPIHAINVRLLDSLENDAVVAEWQRDVLGWRRVR
jgi:hypothetical protein